MLMVHCLRYSETLMGDTGPPSSQPDASPLNSAAVVGDPAWKPWFEPVFTSSLTQATISKHYGQVVPVEGK
eukprot:6386977-Pyramimonas_sp.AAC.1